MKVDSIFEFKRRTDRNMPDFELWCWGRLLRVPWTARRSNQSILKESVLNIWWKDWCWSWNSNTLATSCEELPHLKRPWCWERLKMGGEGINRGWDGWMASPPQWTWVWVNSGSWWRMGRPGMLQSTGSRGVRHDWLTELNWASFLGIWMSSSPSTVLGKTVFPTLNDLTTLSKIIWPYVWRFCWALNSFPLIYNFIFMTVPDCCHYCNFVIMLKSRNVCPPTLFFLLKIGWQFGH